MKIKALRSSLLAVFASTALFAGAASAMPITKTVDISVYQLCDDAGNNCASTGPAGNEYFADATNKIWAQAGISVTFTFISQIFSSAFLDLDDVPGDDFDALHSAYGTGPSTSSIDMFLINDFDGAYGVGWSGLGGLVMSMQSIMDYDCEGVAGCTGRIDTLAHELGHNFGLVALSDPDYFDDPTDSGHSSVDEQLMRGGEYRSVPVTLDDISPDGLGLSQLSDFQIEMARNSSLLRDVPVSGNTVPEPGSLALMAAGLLAVGASRRRRNS
jgi:hypothetical protein